MQVSSGPIYSLGTRFPIESGRVSLRERGIHTFEMHKISTLPDPPLLGRESGTERLVMGGSPYLL